MQQSKFWSAHDIDMERSAEYEEEYLNLTFDPEGETDIAKFRLGLTKSTPEGRITYTPDVRLKYNVYRGEHLDMSSTSLANCVTRFKSYVNGNLDWVHPKWDRAVNRYW